MIAHLDSENVMVCDADDCRTAELMDTLKTPEDWVRTADSKHLCPKCSCTTTDQLQMQFI